jgi:uncharacterized protein (TIGR02145 family)/uncharacterized repeat protein (TIGR02543 family)
VSPEPLAPNFEPEPFAEAEARWWKPQIVWSIGVGASFAKNAGGGITWERSGETVAMPYIGYGAHLFFDATYAEISAGYAVGGGKWESADVFPQSALPDMQRASVNIGALAKYPVTFGSISLFPLLGADCELSISGKLKAKGYDEYPFDGKGGADDGKRPNAGALSALWVKFGVGLDAALGQSLYLRAEALYGLRGANRFETDEAAGKLAKARPADGLTVRTGLGINLGGGRNAVLSGEANRAPDNANEGDSAATPPANPPPPRETKPAHKPKAAAPMPPPQKYALATSASPQNGGVVSPKSYGDYEAGASVTVTATPESGYTFTGWWGASTSKNADITVTMDADKELTANFSKIAPAAPPKYAVTVVSDVSIDASGGGSYAPGATVAVNAGTPPDGWRFKNWTSTGGAFFADAGAVATAFVMPAASITVTANFEKIAFGALRDPRDGKTYRTIAAGGKTWMAQNLNYQTPGGSACYDGKPANCDKYGRLYNWNAALVACPAGWHLPTRQEWNGLASAAGDSSAAGKKLKAASGWKDNGNGIDAYGFSATPGGGRFAGGASNAIEYRGYWWTATELDGNAAYYRGMQYGDDIASEAGNGKTNGFSVRCVED